MTVEDKKCPVFVDGEECGHPLIRVYLETPLRELAAVFGGAFRT